MQEDKQEKCRIISQEVYALLSSRVREEGMSFTDGLVILGGISGAMIVAVPNMDAQEAYERYVTVVEESIKDALAIAERMMKGADA